MTLRSLRLNLKPAVIAKILKVPLGTEVELTPDEVADIKMSNINRFGGGVEICEDLSAGRDTKIFGRVVKVNYKKEKEAR